MRFYAVFLILLIGIGLGSCRERSTTPIANPPPESPSDSSQTAAISSDPQVILDRMVTAYQTAISYSDQATVQIIGTMSQPGIKPIPWNNIVAFQKPNKFRLEINDGIFVSDGENCYAQIGLLPDQALRFPSPGQWTLESLFQDVHLDAAMDLGLPRTVLRFPPQLILLLANNPLNTFCPKGSKIEWVEQRSIDQIQCDVIRINHSDGNRILWISRENSILLRLDYQPVGLPIPEGYESIEAIRIEMIGARFDWNFVSEMFQLSGVVQVAEFQSDMPGLPTAEEHRRRLKLMTDSDTYRRIEQSESTSPPNQPPPKSAPRTFTLTPVWTQPLIGVDAMALLLNETPKLLAPYVANSVAVLDLQGKILHEVSPKELDNSIIIDIRAVKFLSGKQRIGVITLDGKFYLFDELFDSITTYNVEPDGIGKGTIRDFEFIQHQEEEWLLLGIQQNSGLDDAAANGVIHAIDLQGSRRWKYPFEGVLNQISSAVLDNQICVLVSCTASQDQDVILVLAPDGRASDPVNMALGRQIIWFQILDSTLYTLVLSADGYIRFIAMDMNGSGRWSRRLPEGEYVVEPIYLPKEKKWFVPSPSGEIFVFDSVGNQDTFSLDIVPTGLVSVEIDGEILLIVADGETVSAWQVRSHTNF